MRDPFYLLSLNSPSFAVGIEQKGLAVAAMNEAMRCRLGEAKGRAPRLRLRDVLKPLDGFALESALASLQVGEVRRFRCIVPPDSPVPLEAEAVGYAWDGKTLIVLAAADTAQAGVGELEAESRARMFEALLNAMFDGYYDWNLRTGFVEYSPQMEHLLGMHPGSLPLSHLAFIDLVHPEDRARFHANDLEVIHKCGRFLLEYRLRHSNGSYILVEDRGVVLAGADGIPAHEVGTLRDVTLERAANQALEDSQQVYESLFRRATNPALRVDAHGLIMDANEAAVELLGINATEVGRASLADFFPVTFADSLMSDLSDNARVIKREAEIEVHGLVRHLLFTVVPCTVAFEDSYFLLGTDVTPLVDGMKKAIAESEVALRDHVHLLAEHSAAFAAMSERLRMDQVELSRRVASDVDHFILPALDRVQRSLGDRREGVQLAAVRDLLLQVAQPRVPISAAGAVATLTRRELEIAALIRAGRTTSEIAEMLVVSTSTVVFHRRNLRRKLGLEGSRVRLDAHLMTESAPTTTRLQPMEPERQ